MDLLHSIKIKSLFLNSVSKEGNLPVIIDLEALIILLRLFCLKLPESFGKTFQPNKKHNLNRKLSLIHGNRIFNS